MNTVREKILNDVVEFYKKEYPAKPFVPGKTLVPVSGRVFDENEIRTLVDSSLDFWLTAGRFAKTFEEKFSEFLGRKYCSLVNSGSSANLIAISALTSYKLGEKRLKPGDEIITTAASFPTTVNPIFQNNLVPVFVDIDLGTYNANVEQIEKAITDKTRAIFIAHTLGNPFNLGAIKKIATEHDLFLVEDCCDALGSKYGNKLVSSFSDIATFSFYPAHHITMGEGGAVLTDSPQLKLAINSFRDWGRGCWCDTGKDNTCGKRFGWQLGGLPFGYDHKYIYSHIGYNLKLTDMQAAVGVAQLEKLPGFIEARKRNFRQLYDGLKRYEKYLILPKSEPEADPCWFGFPITVQDGAGFSKLDIVNFLENNKIATRALFAGNITRQPAYKESKYRTIGDLKNADKIMRDLFWIGVYPGITQEMIAYVLDKFDEFFASRIK